MKKSLFYVAVVMACGLVATGCNSKEKQLVGTWRLDAAQLESQMPAQYKTSPMASQIKAAIEKEAASITVEFKADHTLVQSAMGKTQSGTWKLDGSTLTMTDTNGKDADKPQAATLSDDGKTISITPNGSKQTLTLIKNS